MESGSDLIFAPLDRVDQSGRPVASIATRAQIREAVAKRRRAQQVRQQVRSTSMVDLPIDHIQEQAIRQNALREANIYFGSQLDPFKVLPSTSLEKTKAGCLDSIKKYSKFILLSRAVVDQPINLGRILISTSLASYTHYP
jgi:hypothetical protein